MYCVLYLKNICIIGFDTHRVLLRDYSWRWLMGQTSVRLWRLVIRVLVLGGYLCLLTGCLPEPTPLPIPPVPQMMSSEDVPPPVQTRNAKVTLVMGSWRTDDVEQMNRILTRFHEKYPNITVKYETYGTSDESVYNPVLESMLKEGTAPDLFYLTSYGFSRKLYDTGYLDQLDIVGGIKENFDSKMRAPWATDNGLPYAVPFIAVSEGVYYNIDIFKKLNLQIPQTWEEFVAMLPVIKQAGIIPLANASGETEAMTESVFMNLLPNFIGGEEGRMAYLEGRRCFNDAHMVAAFQAIKDIAPYFPENQKYLKNDDSLQLFLQGKAAMWLGESWNIPFFEAQKPAFSWSVFAVPPPAGQKPYITFHLDAGMGLNAASQHKDEALLFLNWMATPEFGQLMANELPGFFTMHSTQPTLADEHARTFLKLSEGRGLDARFSLEKINDGSPAAYTLITNETIAVIDGKMTPLEAADDLQNGLVKWYQPAQQCSR
jgi:raffinose/stachyose/melibiose transport system substrate-binding protein